MKRIVVSCVEDKTYRVSSEEIRSYDLDYAKDIIRIDLIDGSFIEINKKYVIGVQLIEEVVNLR